MDDTTSIAEATTFEALGLSPEVLDSIRRIGFERPTPIQAAVIPKALTGRDLVGLAETGSGKTAAFCIPLGERLRHGRGVRGLILSPTREIAMQTKEFLDVFGSGHELDTVELIGGVKIGPQISKLRKHPDILVATPGRLLDHLERRTVSLRRLSELVLDEADHMLDLGFLPQIQAILDQIPARRRTMLFSATMPPPIERLAGRILSDPVTVDLRPTGAAEGIEHRLYWVDDKNKKPCLLSLLDQQAGSTLVFLRRRMDANWAFRQLEVAGHSVARIHSDLSQSQRTSALKKFRAGEFRVLVATDVAARGLDVPRIEHIVNFDPPEGVEDYIHRAGRTARGDRQGVVSTIATWQDRPFVRELEAKLGESIPRHTVPGVEPYIEPKPPKTKRRRRRFL